MATVKLNDLIKSVSGSIGGLELSRRGDKIIARAKPDAAPQPTPARLANQQKFRDAAAYGRAVQADPALALPYAAQARARGVAPYHVALKDFLNPPQILEVDLTLLGTDAGRPVRIRAVDDFEVVQVWFCIRTVEEVLIETGPAALDQASGDWVYLTQTQLVPQKNLIVEATAGDRPAHIGRKTLFCWVH
jgi:hypothetical protein